MYDLESVLQKTSNKKCNMFKKDGGFTKQGTKAYSHLISIVYDLGVLVDCNTICNASKIVDTLDDICDTNY